MILTKIKNMSGIPQIKVKLSNYQSLKSQGDNVLEYFRQYVQINYIVSEIFLDNQKSSFKFRMFGVDFKMALKVDFDNHALFQNGKIVAYRRVKDSNEKVEEIEITSFVFDKIGNIENQYLVNEFSDPFMVKILSILFSANPNLTVDLG